MRFLVTAFEPFGKYPYNPSAALLELLSQKSEKAKNANQAEKNIKSEIIPVLLPTSYSRAAKILSESIDKYHPDCAVLLGLAGGRKAVSLEFVALNIKAADIPDNDGELADGESVIPNKRNALFTTLPLGKMASYIREHGNVPCNVSYHAGTYVCNSTYFNLLCSSVPGCFIHIPFDERSVENASPEAAFIPLDDSLKAVAMAIEYVESHSGEILSTGI